jgi:hypothetical protein
MESDSISQQIQNNSFSLQATNDFQTVVNDEYEMARHSL